MSMIVTMDKINLLDFRINSFMKGKKEVLGDLPQEFRPVRNYKNENEEIFKRNIKIINTQENDEDGLLQIDQEFIKNENEQKSQKEINKR